MLYIKNNGSSEKVIIKERKENDQLGVFLFNFQDFLRQNSKLRKPLINRMMEDHI